MGKINNFQSLEWKCLEFNWIARININFQFCCSFQFPFAHSQLIRGAYITSVHALTHTLAEGEHEFYSESSCINYLGNFIHAIVCFNLIVEMHCSLTNAPRTVVAIDFFSVGRSVDSSDILDEPATFSTCVYRLKYHSPISFDGFNVAWARTYARSTGEVNGNLRFISARRRKWNVKVLISLTMIKC